MAQILVVEPDLTTQSILLELLIDHKLVVVSEPNEAIVKASESKPDIVIIEISLAGHSGMEFLYEFRTYNDWDDVKIIIFSKMILEDTVLNSRSWEQLKISKYLYKPKTSLIELKKSVEEILNKK